MGIYEILQNSPQMRLLIQRNARPTEIYVEAIQSGIRRLRHDALEKCFQGMIDLRQACLAYSEPARQHPEGIFFLSERRS